LAVRQATYKFEDLATFLSAYEENISKASMFFEAGGIDKDVANEFKLDIIVPIVGRLGPLLAQVVHRGPDGSIGVHLPEIPGPVSDAFQSLFGFIGEVRDSLVTSSQVVPRAEYNALVKKLARAEMNQAKAGGPALKRTERGIPIPDISGIEAVVQGSMTNNSLRDAVVGLAVERATGLLTIRYPGGMTRYGYWLRGGVVGWRTDPMNEDEVLGVLLFKAGQVTTEQIKASLEIMKIEGVRQGEALVQMGLIDFSTVIRILGKQAEYILQKVMADGQGEWVFHGLARLPEQFLPAPLNVPSLLFRTLIVQTREMTTVEITHRIEPNIDRYMAISPAANPVLAAMKLSVKERGLVEVIQSNSWRLREVFSVSPLGRSQTSAFIWCLDELALLTMSDHEDLSRAKARVEEQLNRKKKQLQGGTYFDVLDIHWVCLKSEVQDAYKRMKMEFDPGRYTDLEPSQVEEIERINTRFDEAFAAIEPDSGRRRYRAEVIEKDAISNSAEMLGKQGEMGIMRRDRAAACGAFSKAAELVPGESSFRDGLRRATTI
jgi:hypothetical protein